MSILTTSGSRIWLYVFAVICFTHSVTTTLQATIVSAPPLNYKMH